MHHNALMAGELVCSRDELLANASRAARGFDRLGLREGGALALLLRNGFAALEATRGANILGAYAVPIGWHSTTDEVGHIMSDAAPTVLVVNTDLFSKVAAGVPFGTSVLLVADDAHDEAVARALLAEQPERNLKLWSDWLAAQAPWEHAPRPPRGSIIYTSGTTGRPKGVKRLPQTAEAAAAYTQFYRDVFDIRPGMRVFIGGPLYHSTANAFSRAALDVGDLLVLQTAFDGEKLLTLVDEEQITHLIVVPTIFVRLLRLPAEVRARFKGTSLRRVYHTGAPCPPDVRRAMSEWFGPVLYEIYGSTEVGAAVIGSSADQREHPGSVGRPTPGTTIRILDEDRLECPVGGIGEIFIRCAAYSDFTYHNAEELRREVDVDGLVTCGDMGYVDADGFLFLCDRKRDMVISGGVNVYPAEVEAQILRMPEVADCAVFGVADAEFGEKVVAVVVLTTGAALSGEEILLRLRGSLSSHKLPKVVFFETSLPRLETGKIKKAALSETYGRRLLGDGQ